MELSQQTCQQLREWGITLEPSAPSTEPRAHTEIVKLICSTATSRFQLGIALLEICRGEIVVGYTLEEHSGVLHVYMIFAESSLVVSH